MLSSIFSGFALTGPIILTLAVATGAIVTERTEGRFLKSRIKVRIDDNWKFQPGNSVGAEAPDFSDASWGSVVVPHDASIEKVKSGTNDPAAIGWYRRHFTVPANFAGKKVLIQLDGVYHDSKVYINGTLVGSQRYGYISFFYDLTPHLKATGDNVLAVFFDNQTSRRSRWYSGSGMFRHVWLIATDKVYVKNWGTAVSTVGATTAMAPVKIQIEIANDQATAQPRKVETTLYDEAGTAVGTLTSAVTVRANGTDTCNQTLNLSNVKLWGPGSPVMYYAHTRLLDGAAAGDDYVTPFGIRDLKFEANKGFSINGVVTKLKGVNIHSTLIPVGAAVPEAMWERCFRGLMAAGVNFIRTAHNPWAPEALDIADRLGLMLMDEWCDKWDHTTAGNFYIDFEKDWKHDLTNHIIRDRNHPSVIFWDVGNEVEQTGKIQQYIYDNLAKIVPFVKAIDKTRPVTSAVVAGWDGDQAGFAKLAQYQDVIGVNYQDWMYADIHSRVPNALIIGTEQYPYLDGGTPTYNDVKSNAYVMGHNLWTGMDYLGEGGGLGSASGFLDNAVFRKTWFHYQKAQWMSAPTVKIGIGDPVLNSGNAWASPNLSESWNQSGSVRVVAFSNCESVDLYVNSAKVASMAISSNLMIGDFPGIAWQSGMIRAVGLKGGQEVAWDTLKTVGAAAKIVLKADRTQLYADGDDAASIEAYVADAQGQHVWSATQSISVAVAGAGRYLGIGSGDWRSSESFKAESRKAYQGRVLTAVQSTTTPGSITVTVSGEGLASASMTLTTSAQPEVTGLRPSVRQPGAAGTIGGLSSRLDARTGKLKIEYALSLPGQVSLSVLSPAGRTLARLASGYLTSGSHSAEWNAGAHQGIYFVVLKVGEDKRVQKVVSNF